MALVTSLRLSTAIGLLPERDWRAITFEGWHPDPGLGLDPDLLISGGLGGMAYRHRLVGHLLHIVAGLSGFHLLKNCPP